MEYKIVSSTESPRLILFFAGWGMSAAPFEGLRRPGYDIAVLWNYGSLDIDWSFTSNYNEICIVAWSFGVYASAISTHSIDPKVTRRIAVNGTLYPCDAQRGIPPAIFEGTLAGLNERNVAKFYRRMCGTAELYRDFSQCLPQRSIDDLRSELEVFSPDATLLHSLAGHFDLAIIGREDAIIPAVNQWRAWQGVPTVFIEGPHLLDFQRIIDHYILDKQRVGERFASGLKSYDNEAGVQASVVRHIDSMMQAHGVCSRMAMHGCRVLEVGSGTGSLSMILDNAITEGYLEMWDLAGEPCIEGPQRAFRRVDAEVAIAAVPSKSFDVIATASTVQWFNSPARFLRQCSRVLATDGYLVISSFVSGNLAQISAVTGRGLPLMTLEQWRQAVPDGLEIVDIMQRDYDLDFASAIDVFRHLKATGVNALGRNSHGESTLHDILGRYQPDLDCRYHITYRPFIMILQKR